MEDQNGRILLGNLKASEKFGDNLLSGAICMDVFRDKRTPGLIYEYQGKKYINIKVVKRKQKTEYGKTHFIEFDTFVPQGKAESKDTAK